VVGPKGSTARLALERIVRGQGWQLDDVHECLEYPGVLALVSAGLGCALVPALALPDPVTDVRVAALPGLGLRRLVLRHRATREEPAPAVRTVVNALVERAKQVRLA
jgi:DNA-binding transcriptional LysR family regulator